MTDTADRKLDRITLSVGLIALLLTVLVLTQVEIVHLSGMLWPSFVVGLLITIIGSRLTGQTMFER